MMSRRKIGLVLSGGGAKGAGQLGMMLYLAEQGLQPEFISGISVGSLNATFWAQEGDLHLLERLWREIKGNSDIYKNNWFRPWKLIRSIYDNTPLWKKIKKYIDLDKLKQSPIELKIGTVQLQTGAYLLVDKTHHDFQKMLLASTAIPMVFPAITYEGRQYVDGGVRDSAPLKPAIQAGCDQIFVLHCYPLEIGEQMRDFHNLVNIGIRSLAILYNEVLRNDINTCEDINKAVNKGVAFRGGKYRFIELKLIAPAKDQSFGDELDFSPQLIARNIDLGYQIAKEKLE
ncbi:MAG: patatin-like phospholipase family protein [candidate division KSB1 bacterium]|nr:patatin-like phospholipase family protein [candidate division KSB1 bacterium]